MGKRQFRIFSREVKEAAVQRLQRGALPRAVAAELGVRVQLLYSWRDRYEQGGADALVARGRPTRAVAWARRRALLQEPSRQAQAYGHVSEAARATRLAELERKVGQQAVELDFFRAALRHVAAPPPRSGGRGARASSRSSTR